MIDATLTPVRSGAPDPVCIVGRERFDRACARLDWFMHAQARHVARVVGFGFEEDAEAPSTLEQVLTEFSECSRTRRPFRVFNGGSDHGIYSPGGNWAFRFWHDICHAILAAPFDVEGENTVSEAQAQTVAQEFGIGSVEERVFRADTVGQLLYRDRTGRFVHWQREFAFEFINGGLVLAGSREDARQGAEV